MKRCSLCEEEIVQDDFPHRIGEHGNIVFAALIMVAFWFILYGVVALFRWLV